MTDRSANASIKGFLYQFDNTIVRLLEAESGTTVTVEGVEDIDLDQGGETTFIQCKYFQTTEYNHSVIKNAVIQMLRHFHQEGCPSNPIFKYQLYGHFQRGQGKLTPPLQLDCLKNTFLTYKENNIVRKEHDILGINDNQLDAFLNALNVNINAPSYEEQQVEIQKLLKLSIKGSNEDDINIFYYPNAIKTIQALAIKTDIHERRISKEGFLTEINTKKIVFSRWLDEKFGRDHYAKSIKTRHFAFTIDIPK